MLSEAGAVVGIDVGCSPTKRSSAVCLFDWDRSAVKWQTIRFKANDLDRESAISECVGKISILAAAIDGPLKRGFPLIAKYRAAERMLTRRIRPFIGKPGQSSSPVGKLLNKHANLCALTVLDKCDIKPSRHSIAIHDQAIVEAFPTAFLGLLLDNPAQIAARRGDRSDVYFSFLAANGAFDRLLQHLLPGRVLAVAISSVTNHDDRAAFVCALTALCIVAGDFTAVGDEDGWIVLPPVFFIPRWALDLLVQNGREDETGQFFTQHSAKAA